MAVPNTNTFSLKNVQTELSLPTTTDLSTCFKTAVAGEFDPKYSGSKNSLYNFRNYGSDYYVEIITFRTRPWYYGNSLPTTRTNYTAEVWYVTGVTYDVSMLENITLQTRRSDTDAVLSGGAANRVVYRTSRPLPLSTISGFETLTGPLSIYHICIASSYWRTSNPNIYYDHNGWCMDASLLSSSTTLPSITFDTTELEFDYVGTPLTYSSNKFSMTTLSATQWILYCPDTRLSCNTWYGSGSATITVSVNDQDFSQSIEVVTMSNVRYNITVIVYAQGYDETWGGYISWAVNSVVGSEITFAATNNSTSGHPKNGISSDLEWEARNGGTMVYQGTTFSGYLNYGQTSYPVEYCSITFDEIYGRPSGSGLPFMLLEWNS